jgi:membrane protease YdiL (CAAX protease family)
MSYQTMFAAETQSVPTTTVPQSSKRRTLIEISVGYALILVVLWTPRWQRELYLAPVIWIGVTSWLSFESWSAYGLRSTNFLRSLWIGGAALLMAAIAILIAARLGTLHLPATPLQFFERYIGYAIWSFVQEFLVLNFFLRRLLRLFDKTKWAVAAAGLLFAIAHLPNPILTTVTLILGVASCLLFLRYRNLYPLGMAHAIFGICIAITVPGTVSHNMRVGLGYLTYQPHGHHHRRYKDHIVSMTPNLPS